VIPILFATSHFEITLEATPEIAEEYATLKRTSALECNNDIDLYLQGKEEFVKEHERLAIAWSST
jgi:GrpB-like predicted nucleotidyltransferase (UPF0157 family)